MNARRRAFLLGILLAASTAAAAAPGETTAPSSTVMRLLRGILPRVAPATAWPNGSPARNGTRTSAPTVAAAPSPGGSSAPVPSALANGSTVTAARNSLAVRRLQAAYRASGATSGQMEKLLALDAEVFASRLNATSDDIARARRTREQILGPEKTHAVRQYVRDSFLARKGGLMPAGAVGPGPGR